MSETLVKGRILTVRLNPGMEAAPAMLNTALSVFDAEEKPDAP